MIYFMNKVWDPGPPAGWVYWETPTAPDPTGASYPDPYGNGFGACTDYRVAGSRSDGAGGGGTDHREAGIVVGNALAGDTINECDYLDVGDGAQLAAAITAAGLVPCDVWIRPGTYDFSLGSQSVITIPSDVHVRGSGRRTTVIVTRTSGDQCAFILYQDASLEDVGIEVGLPTGACSGGTDVVSLEGFRSAVYRVNIDFPGSWTGVEAALTVLRNCFAFGEGMLATYDAQAVDCWVGLHGDGPWLTDLGLAPGNELVGFAVRTGTGFPKVAATLTRCICNGCDMSVRVQKPARVMESVFKNFMSTGIYLQGDADGSEVADNIIDLDGTIWLGTERGIILSSVSEVGVVDNWIGNGGAAGHMAVEVLSSSWNTIRGNRGPTGMTTAVGLDAASTDNEVIGNVFNGALYTDLGVGNDVAHNK